MVNSKSKSKIILGFVTIGTIIAFIFFIIYVTYTISKAEKPADILQIENTIQASAQTDEENNIPVENRIKVYTIAFKTTSNSNREYILDSDFKVDTTLVADSSITIEFTVNNGAHQFKDILVQDDEHSAEKKQENRFKFNYYRVGDYLCFTNHDAIGDGTSHLYVVDKTGNLYKDISNLDLDNGIKANRVEFKDDRIIIYTTSTTGNKTYTYKVDQNGNIDLNNPVIDM